MDSMACSQDPTTEHYPETNELFHTIVLYFFEIYFNIISIFASKSCIWFLSFGFNIALKLETADPSETLITIYRTA